MISAVGSPQTLSETDRRIVALWAADCAGRVLGIFEAEAPGDSRPRDAIAGARAFARGELGVGRARSLAFAAHAAAREGTAPAAVAAARAAGQAVSTAHMATHALGAAAYASKAAGLTAPGQPSVVTEETRWQLRHMSPAVRTALRQLPSVAKRSSLLGSAGFLGTALLLTIIRDLQADMGDPGQAGLTR